MKKTKFNITILFISLLCLYACGDDYFDVNQPSETATESQILMGDLLAPVIHSTMEGQYSVEETFGNYTQYFVDQDGVAAGRTEADALWAQIYLRVLPNLKVIKEKAAEVNSKHYIAVADILTAINLGMATDTWGNIPYTEAAKEEENFTPIFDTQEAIYNEIFRLLDNGIQLLQQEDTSVFEFGKGDLIYEGDTEKWIKAAYTIKARYQLHLVNKGVIAPKAVIQTVDKGFTSNNDNFLMFYDDKNINPWYKVEVAAKETGNFHHNICEQLVRSMNGDYFPFANPAAIEIDPRLPIFAEKGNEAEWKGYVSGGGGKAPDGTDANTGFAPEEYYTSKNSPLVLITYGEAQFIKAEAAFIANGGTTTSTGTNSVAYQAYMKGIEASMKQYEVDGAAYLADASISVGEANLRLEHILKEKYIHNFLNPETFTDYRRYDFSPDAFRGLEMRVEDGENEIEFQGQWFRRADYPDSERNRNPENVSANKKEPVDPVWWDQ